MIFRLLQHNELMFHLNLLQVYIYILIDLKVEDMEFEFLILLLNILIFESFYLKFLLCLFCHLRLLLLLFLFYFLILFRFHFGKKELIFQMKLLVRKIDLRKSLYLVRLIDIKELLSFLLYKIVFLGNILIFHLVFVLFVHLKV